MTDPHRAGPTIEPTLLVGTTESTEVLEDTLDEPELDPLVDTTLGLWAVVFAGGIGSRFWPSARPHARSRCSRW